MHLREREKERTRKIDREREGLELVGVLTIKLLHYLIHNVSAKLSKFIWSITASLLQISEVQGEKNASDVVPCVRVFICIRHTKTKVCYCVLFKCSHADICIDLMNKCNKLYVCHISVWLLKPCTRLPVKLTHYRLFFSLSLSFFSLCFSFERANYRLRLPETAEGHPQTSRWPGEVAKGQ